MTTARQVLDTPMDSNGADAATIRDYLIELLSKLWDDADGFSSKRPFGDDDWQWVVYAALIRAELVEGSFDRDDCVDEIDMGAADTLVQMAIVALGSDSAVAR